MRNSMAASNGAACSLQTVDTRPLLLARDEASVFTTFVADTEPLSIYSIQISHSVEVTRAQVNVLPVVGECFVMTL